MKIKAVLFDLDGTLLPMDQDIFIKAYLGGLCAALAPKGYEPKAVAAALWKSTDAMVKNDGSKSNEQAFWDSFCAILGNEVRGEEPLLEHFYKTDFQMVKNVCGYTPLSKQLVDRLHHEGIRVALSTNPLFPAVATESRIRWAGLEPSDFELVTTYEGIGYCKPNPEYYLEIARRIGVEPQECLMVGNDVGDDMVAESLGMKVFLLTDCLINKDGGDISHYPNGSFDALNSYIDEVVL